MDIIDIDLSPFSKINEIQKSFYLVKDHMRKFSSEGQLGRITSSYRAYIERKKSFIADPSTIDSNSNTYKKIRHLFFPVLILLALIPEEKERRLTIESIMVKDQKVTNKTNTLRSLVGKGSLIIKKLTVVCTSSELCNINKLKEQMTELGNIKFEYIKIKVAIDSTQNFNSFLEELDAASVGADEVKIMLGTDESHKKIILNEADMNKISTRLEDDDFDAEVPILEGIYDSPHTFMIEKPLNLPVEFLFLNGSDSPIMPYPYQTVTTLIATLGHGFPPSVDHGPYTRGDLHYRIIEKKNTTNDTAPVYHDQSAGHPSLIINDYSKISGSFVICQTTYCNGVIANGATSKAIKWLREKWKETWKDEYDNLVVLIPYGGQYMEDEMIQIHEATNEGIIIVCAAGGMGEDVVFPAAFGTVLSVGVSNRGPKGREMDIHVSEKISTQTFFVPRSIDCGVAAARITGHLALLLSRINFILNSNLTDPCNKEMASAIKKIPHYLHTCIIRELLVNEGNGSHHLQLGYGDGEKILGNLLRLDKSRLLEQLADVLLKEVVRVGNTINTSQYKEITEEEREKLYHNLHGNGITVAVLDYDSEKDQHVEKGPEGTSFKHFKSTDTLSQHGEQCSSVVHAVSPKTSILCANNVEANYHLAFNDCISRSPPIDVISYSISLPYFHSGMCAAVNEAVVAGKIIVFAAGNTGKRLRNTIEYPGRIGNILVVGGRDPHYNRIGFSSVGREMDFLAEGETGDLRGTSYAAPVVAGYIALLLQFIKENMNTDEDRIRAWSKNSQDEYEWQDIPAFDAAHNVYAMRTLLKLLVPKPKDHSDTEGFGCLDFSKLFPRYKMPNSHELVTGSAKTKIRNTLQRFYKHQQTEQSEQFELVCISALSSSD